MTDSRGESPEGAVLMREKHIKFFVRCLSVIPQDLEKLDTVRYVKFSKYLPVLVLILKGVN